MQITFLEGGRRHELDVELNNPSATVADLAAALDPTGTRSAAGGQLSIGGRTAEPDLDIREAGLHEGAVVSFDAAPPAPVPSPGTPNGATPAIAGVVPGGPVPGTTDPRVPARDLVVTGGLDAGHRFPLRPGTWVIGRDPGCDIVVAHGTVSARHATLTVAADGTMTLADLGSHNGTWLTGEPVVDTVALTESTHLRLGALDLEVRPARHQDRPMTVEPRRDVGVAGTIPFNRPPRPAPPQPAEPIHAPKAPGHQEARGHGSIMMMIGPVVMGCVAYFAGYREYAIIALLTPLIAVGRFIENRRSGRRRRKQEQKRFARELPEFEARLAELADGERRRRERAHPDPAEIVRRVTLPSTTLWERRPGDADFLQLRAGVGDVGWEPPIAELTIDDQTHEELAAAVQRASVLTGAATTVDLADRGVVGIVGDRTAALALARSLVCQAAALHGPADLPVMVLAGGEQAPAWDWAKWLPHTRSPTGRSRMLSGSSELSAHLVESRLRAARTDDRGTPGGVSGGAAGTGGVGGGARGRESVRGPALLAVVDDESLTRGRRAPTRGLLRGEGGPVAGIVLASTADRLPAVCTTVVEMDGPDGVAVLTRPQLGEQVSNLMACGLGEDVARDCARTLARYEDPELEVVGAGLPATVRLLPLLELEECSPERVLDRWRAAGPDPHPAAPIGVTEEDVFTLDLARDGPHGLVGGTTGAGKSELLRAMVGGLAASVDPDHLTFVLIDFKGGSAFDECAQLPHTVGLVTDLDEHLAERALRCLEAELKHRERVLRDAGAIDLPDYLRGGEGREPLPRLLVIVDEFATLRAELPDFIDALVGVAQRGRSLGVHMLLATQRPQGAISENIRANTNMRIALRMQDDADSRDVIGIPDAGAISRDAPGRLYARLGPGEVIAVQSALATGNWSGSAPASVDLAPFTYGPQPRARTSTGPGSAGGATGPGSPQPPTAETDLGVLVAAIGEAFDRTGRPRPRRPWPDELPHDLDLDELLELAGEAPGPVPLALADDPDAQAQYPVGWDPDQGNLLVYGVVGSGTTTLLGSLALSLARRHDPGDLHIYALDLGGGELAPLADLPHCGAVALAHEQERQHRMLRLLRSELDRRRGLGPAERDGLPRLVAMVDGWPAFRDEHDDTAGREVIESFVRVCADGAEVGINVVLTADRAAAVTSRVAASARQRWALRLADSGDYQQLVQVPKRAVPTMVPGHALVSETRQLVHVARPAGGLAAAVARYRATGPAPAPDRAPTPVRSLPATVHLAELGTSATLDRRPWVVPVGLAEHDLEPAALVAYPGEHALVAGPARSGRSTTLLTVADAVLAARPDARVVGVADARSPLADDARVHHLVAPDDAPDELPRALELDVPVLLVLVDDADRIDDRRLEGFGTGRHDHALIVAAGRPDVLRGIKHWTRAIRGSKLGVVLRPEGDNEGDALATRLPRRHRVAMATGRGYVVNSGEPVLAQLALPDVTHGRDR